MSVKHSRKLRATVARGDGGTVVFTNRDVHGRRQVIFEEDALVYLPIVERAVIEAMTGTTDGNDDDAMTDVMLGGAVGERTAALLNGRLAQAQPADRMAMALALTPEFNEREYYTATRRKNGDGKDGGDPLIEFHLGPRAAIDSETRTRINDAFQRLGDALPADDPNKNVAAEKLHALALASEQDALGAVGDAPPAVTSDAIASGREPAVHQLRRIARELGGERAASRDWKRVMGATRLYTHSASTSHGVVYGLAFFARAAHINHSCLPNAELVVVGSRARLYACRPIRGGDEITISYLNALDCEQLVQRRSMLSDPTTYSFACTCHRCSVETSSAEFAARTVALHREAIEEIGPEGVELMHTIRQCTRQESMREMLQSLAEYRARVHTVLLRYEQFDLTRKIIGLAFNAVVFMFLHGNVDVPAPVVAPPTDVDALSDAIAATTIQDAPPTTVDALSDAIAATTIQDAATPPPPQEATLGNPLRKFVTEYYDTIVWVLSEMGRSLTVSRTIGDRLMHGSMRQMLVRWSTFGLGAAMQMIGCFIPDALLSDAAARQQFYREDARCRELELMRLQFAAIVNALCDEYSTDVDDGSWMLYADRHAIITTDRLCRDRARPWTPPPRRTAPQRYESETLAAAVAANGTGSE